MLSLIGGLVVWRIYAHQMLAEKIDPAPLTMPPVATVTCAREHYEVEILVRPDKRVDESVGRFRRYVLVRFAYAQK